MVEGLDAEEYEALVTGAETYRAALVVRLGGEAGLRTGEITCVTPGHLRETEGDADLSLLAVPSDDTEGETKAGDDPETEAHHGTTAGSTAKRRFRRHWQPSCGGTQRAPTSASRSHSSTCRPAASR